MLTALDAQSGVPTTASSLPNTHKSTLSQCLTSYTIPQRVSSRLLQQFLPMEVPRPSYLGPDGWPDIPKVVPAPGYGRNGGSWAPNVYTHTPLDPDRKEIRLLYVEQRRPHPDQPEYYQLRMGLRVVSLLDNPAPEFKALSYVWNDQNPLPDAPDPDRFLLKKNNRLIMAMKELSKDGPLLIWVDALCINQENEEEKSSQVSMMADIYQAASEVIAWLGPESQFFNRGLTALDAWAQFAVDYNDQPWLQKTDWTVRGNRPLREVADLLEDMVNTARTAIPDAFGDPLVHDSIAQSLYIISRITYWTRAWIFQELAFASEVRIQNGSKSITLRAVLNAMKACIVIYRACQLVTPQVWNQRKGSWVTTPLGEAVGMFGRELGSVSMYSMCETLYEVRNADSPAVFGSSLTLDLLLRFSNFDSTDPRDKVFALWGFMDPMDPYAFLLQPNYSLEAHEVYTQATQYLILSRENLDVLEFRGSSQLTDSIVAEYNQIIPTSKLPSWVPDWQYRVDTSYPHKGVPVTSGRFSFNDVVHFSPDGRTLVAKATSGHTITTLLTHDMFPFPVPTGDGSKDMVLDNVKWFVTDIVSRGQGVLCQYLRHTQRYRMTSDSAQSPDAPLDILAGLAGGSMSTDEVRHGKGNGISFLSLVRALKPIAELLFDRNANGKLPQVRWEFHPLASALMVLADREKGSEADGWPSRFPIEEGVDEDEDEQLRRAIELSMQDIDLTAAISDGDNADEEELLRQAIELSLGIPPSPPILEVTEADLCSFEWLGQLLDALSAPDTPRAITVRQALAAMMCVEAVERMDIDTQKLTRPGREPWISTWNTGIPWRFFMTADGKLGAHSSYADLQPGDKVRWFAAHSVPFIVRESEDGSCKLIGRCYMLEKESQTMQDDEVEKMKWLQIT